uniref:ABC transporter ATP-binding protein n=1 Tax=Kitasatospora sp. NRRL F-6133 TaxID=1415539 RepID=U5YRL3_9ACTN|nr:ABC transporter ATP-binding protein [Kitasatospora sp. NRRL F-6133]
MKAFLHAVSFLVRLSWRTDRARLLKAFALVMVGYLATPLTALALRDFTNAALGGETGAARLYGLATAVLLIFELLMGHFAHLTYFELGEIEEEALHAELVRICNGTRGIEHFDSAGFAETMTLVREELGRMRLAVEAVLQLTGLLVQVLITTVVLATVDPWLVLLPLAGFPPVLISNASQRLVDRAKTASASATQLSRHLLELATTGSSAKEIKLFGIEERLIGRQRAEWDASARRLGRAQLTAAAARAAGQAVFAAAYGGALVLVVRRAVDGQVNVGSVVLVIALAVQVSVQVAAGLGLLSTLQGAGLAVERIGSLRDRVRPDPEPVGDPQDAPARLRSGIRLENVSFGYPGTDRLVLRDVTVDIPAGSSVALVGENGAGKSTLVKLLCGLYEPSSGRILVDGVDLRSLRGRSWQDRVAMLFQDFARLELLLRENVGIGHVPALGSDAEVRAALAGAQAEDLVAKVPGGLDGLLGRAYGDGAELSGGQWQKLGLARAGMRGRPLLLALDEPASALDPSAEHRLYESLVASSDAAARTVGAVTLFTSHRFSTVRIADLILVLDGGSVVASGSHQELMAEQGLYAELFGMQARAYR